MAQEDALTYLRHGQSPFFRLPVAVGDVPAGTRAVLLGVPSDLGTTYQPGARLAPWHVRRVSALVELVPELVELDLHPVMLHERGAVAVDASARFAGMELAAS